MGIFQEGYNQATGPGDNPFGPPSGSFRNTSFSGPFAGSSFTLPEWQGDFDQSHQFAGYHDPGFLQGLTAPFSQPPAGVNVADYMTESSHSAAYRPADATANFMQQYGLPFLGVAAGMRLNRIRVARSNTAAGSLAAGASRTFGTVMGRSSDDIAKAATRARSTTGLLTATGDAFGKGAADGFFNAGRRFTRIGVFGDGAAATATRGGIRAGLGMAGGAAASLFLPFLLAEGGMKALDAGVFKPYIDMRRGQETLRANFENRYFGQENGGGVLHGMGISATASARVSRELQDAGTQDLALSGRAYQAIADYSARSGLLDDVSNVNDIPGRVSEIARQVKSTMATTNTASVREAVNTIARARDMGASTRVRTEALGSQFTRGNQNFAASIGETFGPRPYEGTYYSSSRAREEARQRAREASEVQDRQSARQIAEGQVPKPETGDYVTGSIPSQIARQVAEGRVPRSELRSYVSESRSRQLGQEGSADRLQYFPDPAFEKASNTLANAASINDRASTATVKANTPEERDLNEALKEIARQGRDRSSSSVTRPARGEVRDLEAPRISGDAEARRPNSNPSNITPSGSGSMSDAVKALQTLARQGEQTEQRRKLQQDQLGKASSALESIAKNQTGRGGSQATEAGRRAFEDISRIGVSQAEKTISQMQGYAAISGISSDDLYRRAGDFGARAAQQNGMVSYLGALEAGRIYSNVSSAIQSGMLTAEGRNRLNGAEGVAQGAAAVTAGIFSDERTNPYLYNVIRGGDPNATFNEAVNGQYGQDMSKDPLNTMGTLVIQGGAAREKISQDKGSMQNASLGTIIQTMEASNLGSQMYNEDGKVKASAIAGFLKMQGYEERQINQYLAATYFSQDDQVLQRNVDAIGADGQRATENLVQQEGLVGGNTALGNVMTGVHQVSRSAVGFMQNLPGAYTELTGRIDDSIAKIHHRLFFGSDEDTEKFSVSGTSREDAVTLARRITNSSGEVAEKDIKELERITGRRELSGDSARAMAEEIQGKRQVFDVDSYKVAPTSSGMFGLFSRGSRTDRAVKETARFANDIVNDEYKDATPQDKQRARAFIRARTPEDRENALQNLLGSNLARDEGLSDNLGVEGLSSKFASIELTDQKVGEGFRVEGSKADLRRSSSEIAKEVGLDAERGSLTGLKAYQIGRNLGLKMTEENADIGAIRQSRDYQQFGQMFGLSNYEDIREKVRQVVRSGDEKAGRLTAAAMEKISVDEASKPDNDEAARLAGTYIGQRMADGVSNTRIELPGNSTLSQIMAIGKKTEMVQQQQSETVTTSENSVSRQIAFGPQEIKSFGVSSEKLSASSDMMNSASSELSSSSKALNEASTKMQEAFADFQEEMKKQRVGGSNAWNSLSDFSLRMRPGG